MSVFAQYVPHTFATGDWESRRQEVTDLALGSIARFCSNIPDAVLKVETLGPPDIEQRVGLTGGHIFQGECLPAYMWSNRLELSYSDARRVPLRRLYPPRRQRHRRQRPQRGAGGPRRVAAVEGTGALRSRRQFSTHQGIGLVIRSLDASFGRFMVVLICGYQHRIERLDEGVRDADLDDPPGAAKTPSPGGRSAWKADDCFRYGVADCCCEGFGELCCRSVIDAA